MENSTTESAFMAPVAIGDPIPALKVIPTV